MKKNRLLIALTCFFCVSSSLIAETVILKDGSKIKGKIVGSTDSSVSFDGLNGTMTIDKANIQSIDYSDVTPVAAPAATPEPNNPPAPAHQKLSDVSSRRLLIFGAGDIYGTGGMNEEFEKETRDAVDAFNSVGIIASGSTKTSPGYGARIGLLFPQKGDFEIGTSVGLVVGPRVVQTLDNGPFTYIPTGQTFNYNGETKVTTTPVFLRALLELGKRFSISDKIFIRLGAGAGIAAAGVAQFRRTEGSIAAVLGDRDVREHWSGFTWEVSPSIILPLGTAEVEFGLRYAQFPKKKESEDIGKIEWNPFSIFAGFRFGV